VQNLVRLRDQVFAKQMLFQRMRRQEMLRQKGLLLQRPVRDEVQNILG